MCVVHTHRWCCRDSAYKQNWCCANCTATCGMLQSTAWAYYYRPAPSDARASPRGNPSILVRQVKCLRRISYVRTAVLAERLADEWTFFRIPVLCTYFNFTHSRRSRGVTPSAPPMIAHSVLSCQLSRQRWAGAYAARHSSLNKHCSSVMSTSSECTNNRKSSQQQQIWFHIWIFGLKPIRIRLVR